MATRADSAVAKVMRSATWAEGLAADGDEDESLFLGSGVENGAASGGVETSLRITGKRVPVILSLLAFPVPVCLGERNCASSMDRGRSRSTTVLASFWHKMDVRDELMVRLSVSG